MKINILTFLFTIVCLVANSQSFTLNMSKSGAHPNTRIDYYLVANNAAAAAYSGQQTTDFTFTTEYPTAAGVALGAFIPVTSGGINMVIPAGAPQVVGALTRQGYQLGNVNGVNMFSLPVGVPVLVGSQPFVATNPGASIATFTTNLPGQPNVGFNGFEDFTPTLTGAAPLPIKLSTFFAEKNGENAVNLNWTSKSEVNASHFDVERSVNNISSFEKIGEVKAAGNSSSEIKYDFVDNNLPFSRDNQHTFYYRLNQVDIDGFAEYSEIRSVTFIDDLTVKVTTYPNPASSSIFVEMSSKSAKEDAKLYLMDASGKLVTSRTISANGVSEIEVSQYLNGIYNIMIQHDGKVYNQKVIKTN